jgi:hypothetical protein
VAGPQGHNGPLLLPWPPASSPPGPLRCHRKRENPVHATSHPALVCSVLIAKSVGNGASRNEAGARAARGAFVDAPRPHCGGVRNPPINYVPVTWALEGRACCFGRTRFYRLCGASRRPAAFGAHAWVTSPLSIGSAPCPPPAARRASSPACGSSGPSSQSGLPSGGSRRSLSTVLLARRTISVASGRGRHREGER